MKHIFKCNHCSKYTMKEACDCGSKASLLRPLNYSPNEKLSYYRRKAKIKEYTERGLI